MDIGLNLPVIAPGMSPDWLRSLTQAAEAYGFAEVFVGEHVVLFDEQADAYPGKGGKLPFPPTTPLPDPLVTLAFLASATTKIRLATGVMVLAQRNPVYTAKHLATLDWLSAGRLDVGIGLGWSSREYAAVGVPFADRGARTDEYVELLRRLWADEPTEFTGRFWNLPSCYQRPLPAQRPHPPLWFGGNSPAALSRVARSGDGWYAFNTRPDVLAGQLERLDRELADRSRRRADVKVVLGTIGWEPKDRDALAPFEALGVDLLAVSLHATDRAAMDAELARLGELIGKPA